MKFSDVDHIHFLKDDGTVDEEALRQYKEWIARQDPAFLAEIDRKAKEAAKDTMEHAMRGKNTFEHDSGAGSGLTVENEGQRTRSEMSESW